MRTLFTTFLPTCLGMAVVLLAVALAQPAAPVQLTEIEKLRVDNVILLGELRKAIVEAQGCRGDLAKAQAEQLQQQVTAATQKLRADVEANHPGYWWDPTTGAFTQKPEGRH